LVEAGKANPSLSTIMQLADALGLNMHLVLNEPGNLSK
jgi:DNA-binding phage protein